VRLGGAAAAPREEAGPGGMVTEVRYRWPDLGKLLG
jgi:hypothetical protein